MQESLFKQIGRPASHDFFKSHVQQFFSEFCQKLHGTFFTEHLRATASTKYTFVHWVNLSPKMLHLACSFFLISFKYLQSNNRDRLHVAFLEFLDNWLWLNWYVPDKARDTSKMLVEIRSSCPVVSSVL